MPKLSVKTIRQVVSTRIGNDVLELVMTLKKNEEISEFELAKLLKEEINGVRNKLYRLQQQNLISFKKKKDEQKGWYTYFWRLRYEMFHYLYKKMIHEELGSINNTIETEEKAYYSCSNGCLHLSEKEALELGYQCPDCGGLLGLCKPPKKLDKLYKRREKLIKAMENFG